MATILPLRLQRGLGSGVPGMDCRVPSVPRTELSTTAGSQSYLEVGHLSEHASSNSSTVFFFFFLPTRDQNGPLERKIERPDLPVSRPQAPF